MNPFNGISAADKCIYFIKALFCAVPTYYIMKAKHEWIDKSDDDEGVLFA